MNSLINHSLVKNIFTLFAFPQTSSNDEVRSQSAASKPAAERAKEFAGEVQRYLLAHPDTKHVDIYLNDVNGTFRGKRIAVDSLLALSSGCYFPQSVYAMDHEGKPFSHADGSHEYDEPDGLCLPVAGTLRPCVHDPRHNAQLLLTMKQNDGTGYALEPRVVLENVLHKFHYHGLYPVAAPEIEFYLVSKAQQESPAQGCFYMPVPSDYTAFIEELEQAAAAQGLPLSAIVCEAEAGQFELNLKHSRKVVEICENVLALRRLTSIVADKFGYQANFMAKPFSHLAGNGLHFHISLNDRNGDNVFASPAEALNEMAQLCLAGMLQLMPATVAVIAPHVNSFRRLRKNLNEPLFSSWGYNKRSAALRIPCSDDGNRRIEYRLAGADVNPYLAMAAILTGMLYGLENIDSDTLKNAALFAPELPLFQNTAIEEFRQSAYMSANLGEAFAQQWVTHKLTELARFETIVTPEEAAFSR